MGGSPYAAIALSCRVEDMPTIDLRFAADEKGMKTVAAALVGREISYWADDRTLRRGRVAEASVERDRYGNPFVRVTLENSLRPPAPSEPAAA